MTLVPCSDCKHHLHLLNNPIRHAVFNDKCCLLLVIKNARPIVEIANNLGIKPQTLGKWAQTAMEQHPKPVNGSKTDYQY